MVKTRRSGILIGTAGVYFVASRLAAKGFHAAPTFGNAPHIDILVGLPDGEATASIQVKTTWRALRTRGRSKDKQPHHYEWDVGERSARLNQPGLFFTFVDLKGAGTEMPDVFIVPSDVISKAFDRLYFTSGVKRRWRWHPKVESVEQFKNDWNLLGDYLKSKKQFA
ncbi:hypothetical protein ACFLXT_04435 [Chloroflexota bacterium]